MDSMKKVKIDNMAKFYSLMLLYERNRHGYEMIKSIGEKMEKKISPGQIYPFLKEMKGGRLLESKKEGARGKTVYALTSKGRKFVKETLMHLSDMIRIAVKSDLSVCRHCECEIYSGGYEERGNVFCCKSCAAAYGRQG